MTRSITSLGLSMVCWRSVNVRPSMRLASESTTSRQGFFFTRLGFAYREFSNFIVEPFGDVGVAPNTTGFVFIFNLLNTNTLVTITRMRVHSNSRGCISGSLRKPWVTRKSTASSSVRSFNSNISKRLYVSSRAAIVNEGTVHTFHECCNQP